MEIGNMKFAMLSDIHGNIFALEACFKLIDEMKVDAIIGCGDYITDIPKSHEVIEFVRNTTKKYRTYFVRGNREEYILDYHNSEKTAWSMENRNGPLLCAYQELKQEDIEFISRLPESCVIDVPEVPKIFVSHKINEDAGNDCKYKIFGHSHKQQVFTKDNIKYINPGSVGVAIGGNSGAEFSVLEISQNYYKIENYNVRYDTNEPIKAIRESKLNETKVKWGNGLIKLLQTGIDYPGLYIKEVLQIAREQDLMEDLDELPMTVWKEARKRIEIE